MVYVIAEPCVDVLDKSCVDVCPVDCIYEGNRKLYINPDECIDCGACETACPMEAIFRADDLPDEWSVHELANAQFVEDFDAVGGAMNVGPFDGDRGIDGLPAKGSGAN